MRVHNDVVSRVFCGWVCARAQIKLLLLGAGESGKSTIFKQMKILYGDPTMSADDMMLVRSIIHNNLITTMQTLCEYCETFGLKDELEGDEEDAFGKMEEADETDDLTDEIGEALKVLWKAGPIQKTWDRRDEFQVIESLKYYFDNIDRVARTDYMDYTKSVLRAHPIGKRGRGVRQRVTERRAA